MKNPKIVALVIQTFQHADDIRLSLPLQREGQYYFITIERFKFFYFTNHICDSDYDDVNIYVVMNYNGIEDYYHIQEPFILVNDRLQFECGFIDNQDQLNFLIACKNEVVSTLHQQGQNKKIQSLEKQQKDTLNQLFIVCNEQQKLNQKFVETYGLKKKPYIPPTLDLAILYSNPLVQTQSTNLYKQPVQPVGYYNEIQQIKKNFTSLNIGIKYRILVATKSNLIEVLNMKPQVIQIISHGDFDGKKFYLAFENNGILERLYQDDLEHIFKESKSDSIKLLLLSCCHSGEIADIIQNAKNIPSVIAVSSEYKIEESASQHFSASLFQNLFLIKPVNESFEKAKQDVKSQQGNNCYTCCCAHKHVKNCPFDAKRQSRENGYKDMHYQHTPSSQCLCLKRQQNIHRVQCEWAQQYVNYLFDDDINLEELVFDTNTNEIKICCCELSDIMDGQPINQKNHDESEKFQLKQKSQDIYNDSEMTPFKNVTETDPQEIQSHNITNITIIGRNLELYQIYTHITTKNKDILYIMGRQGSGRSELVNQGVLYTKERNPYIKSIIQQENQIINVIKIQNVQDLKNMLNQKITLNDSQQYCVLVLDNIDHLLINDRSTFFQETKVVQERFQNLSLILIMDSENEDKIPPNQKLIELKQFGQDQIDICEQILMANITEKQRILNKEYYVTLQKIFQIIDLYPKSIIDVANYQNHSNKSFDYTYNHFKQIKEKRDQQDRKLQSKLNQTQDILLLK